MTSTKPIRLVGDYVLTGEEADPVIAGGAIDIGPGGRVTAVGPEAELDPGPEVRRMGGLLMPGLVNAHAHTPMTLVRSVGDGMDLQRWLSESVWPLESRMSAEDVRWGMVVGSAEMLLNGVTTSCEMYLWEEAVAEAVAETGGRLVITPGVIAALTPGQDPTERLDQIDRFHASHHDPGGRITVGYAPHSIYDLSPEVCGRIAERAQAVGALVHIHLEETRAERDEVRQRWGASATRLLADAGFFEGPTLVAHGVWLDAEDRAILAEAGAAVVHCPQSNLKLGSGIAPVADLLAAGVRVALGTDGPASNDDLDLWEELRLAPLLVRGVSHDPTAMSAGRAIRMATAGGGAALDLPDVGQLRPGAWADVIRLDLDHPAFCPLFPDRLVTQVAFAGSSRAVTDVWVAGDPVVVDRHLVTVDLERLLAEGNRRAAALTGSC
jgi:5-methylthioadenosine/S-adenosylhomocysteine deaminase